MIAPKWIEPPAAEQAAVKTLAVELGISEFFAALLCRRGFSAPEHARKFLEPKLKSLADPFLLPNMGLAVERILGAIDRGERIVLYGDYDVDGITSLALVTRMLRAFGVEAPAFLPHRMEEGYGLSAEGIVRCIESFQPQLLIALDCGTSSVREIATLCEQGIDVVVLDHHECKTELPNCVLVNPKIGADFHYLCSVGVVFKLCHALLKTRPLAEFALRKSLDLVALGTVADIVPLVGENRILVRRGLIELAQTESIGLRALMAVAGVKAPVRTGDIGFRLGPRLNAAGRLRTAEDALELLLTENTERARVLATALDTENRERQKVEQTILQQAEEQLRTIFIRDRDAAIVLGDNGWHPGVLGIVASRLSKAHHRPTFVIGFDENGLGKGSGRSIEGLSLVHALGKCGALLDKFGGHEM
ncbi:MAG: single-stranded-DNA-specific exonuclease RecJ, partial [Verrucomicrobiota bacterium]|nr:single-stranded-DNA-specific exonuclease RecJ [Verrucomicrobiota bacterium]